MFRKMFKGSSGQALVEFAIILPLFIILAFGVIEISKVGYTFVSLNNAVRGGVRVASVGGLNSEITNYIASSSPYLDATKINIIITPSESVRRSGSLVKVYASYPVYLSTPVIGSILPNPVLLQTSLSMRME